MKNVCLLLALFFLAINPSIVLSVDDPLKSQLSDSSEKALKGDLSYSGYYVFDGKMYFYNQNSGEFNVVSDSSTKKDTVKSDEVLPNDQNQDLINKLREADSSVRSSNSQKPLFAAAGRIGQLSGNAPAGCSGWGSPFLSDKTYTSKDECDSDLENALDKALVTIDKYSQMFDDKKKALMITAANSEELNKLTSIKVNFAKSKEVIAQTFKQGCICNN